MLLCDWKTANSCCWDKNKNVMENGRDHAKRLRIAYVADACILVLLAVGVGALALSLLFPPLAIPIITSAIIGSIGIPAVTIATGVVLGGLSLLIFAGCIMSARNAYKCTKLIHDSRG